MRTAERIPPSGRLWVRLTLLLTFLTLFTGTVSVLMYASVVRGSIARLSAETRAGMVRDLGLPEKSFDNPRPLFELRGWFIVPMVASLGFGSGVCLIVALIVARRFVRPLEHLTQTAQQIASGDLGARSPALVGPSEVGHLIENVNHMAVRLEHFDAERRATSAAIAHELRTPLASLRMRVAGLEEGVYPLERAEIGKLHRQIDVLSRLADDLQTLTLADAGGLNMVMQPFDLGEFTRQALEDMKLRFQERQVQTRLELQVAPILADPQRIEQVLNNLLENAARYAPSSSQVEIQLRQVNGRVQLRMQNPGAQISPHEATQLFERFYRSDASRARASGGSGLGLAIVRAIIEAHGGRVWAVVQAADRLEVGFELPIGLANP